MQPPSFGTTRPLDPERLPLATVQLLESPHRARPIGLPWPPPVRAVEVVRRMRGPSQPWLVRCDDGCYYVVKFRNNPQHPRVLANELLASRLALLVALPVAAPALVEVAPELVAADGRPEFNAGNCRERCTAGLHFGSRFAGPPERTIVVDFLPDRLLSRVDNLAPLFLGGFVFDRWTCNCDDRQVVFFRPLDGTAPAYSGLLIDQGLCFNGGEWDFPDSPIRGLYRRRLVYDSVTGVASFEPFLSRIEGLRPPKIEECIADIPSEWCWPDRGQLEPLVGKLYARRRMIAGLIIDAVASLRPFRNWAQSL